MATDYQRITKENIGRYGTAIDEYGPRFLADRYSDRTHFVYELLQNAEDAIGWRHNDKAQFPRNVAFQLHADALRFRHYGLPFTEEHVRGICDIGKGTKGDDLTTIGNHGIGFKSVYTYTHHPEIHSGQEHFVIDLFVRPHSASPHITEDGETLFVLPFDHPKVSKKKAYEEIAERLSRLGLKTLLFLRNIQSITWETDRGQTGVYTRKTRPLVAGIERVTLRGQQNNADTELEEWIVCRKPVKHAGQAAGFVEIAFSLRTDGYGKNGIIVPVLESPLIVFFPTEKETHFRFLMQGPYRTTPSRDNVPKDDPWNQGLVSSTADLLLHSLKQLREADLLTVSALETLIVSPAKYEGDSHAAMFRPISDAIVHALKNVPLIPAFAGGYVAGSCARFARGDSLRRLLSPRQLQDYTGEKAPLNWVTGEICRDQSPLLRDFLEQPIGIPEIGSVEFLRLVSPAFLHAQSDSWISKFYAFLGKPPFPPARATFQTKEIVRLEDGAHVTPFAQDGKPNAYLPGNVRTDLPTIRRKVCKRIDARRFLLRLGLREPDPVDDVIHNVLRRYQDSSTQLPSKYEEDLRRIVAAFQTDSARLREQLLQQLRQTPWIPCRNAANGELILGTAENNTYLANKKLQSLFNRNLHVRFVERSSPPLRGEKGLSVLKACGVAEVLQRSPIACTLASDELRQIRVQAGLEKQTSYTTRDYEICGLHLTLKEIADATRERRERLSHLLWECLHDAFDEWGREFFYGEYSWRYSHEERTEQFPAQFVRLLRDSPWLPSPNGEPTRPANVCFAELPEAFQAQANAAIVEMLEFKPNEVKQLAAASGIPEDILDLVRQGGRSNDELRKFLAVRKLPPRLPPSRQPGRAAQADVEATVGIILGEDYPGPTPPCNVDAESQPADSDARETTDNNSTGRPGGNAGRVSGSPSSKQRYHTYVAGEHEQPTHERQNTQEEKMALEAAAVEFIIQQEADMFAEIRRMPANHEGYDLEAVGDDGGVLRYIEVKALGCAWKVRPATISEAQFKAARCLGGKFWLYVVERAGQPDAHIHRIRDPAGLVRYFTFDDGWSGVVEE